MPVEEPESLKFIVKFATMFISLIKMNRRFISLPIILVLNQQKRYVESNFRLPFVRVKNLSKGKHHTNIKHMHSKHKYSSLSLKRDCMFK